MQKITYKIENTFFLPEELVIKKCPDGYQTIEHRDFPGVGFSFDWVPCQDIFDERPNTPSIKPKDKKMILSLIEESFIEGNEGMSEVKELSNEDISHYQWLTRDRNNPEPQKEVAA